MILTDLLKSTRQYFWDLDFDEVEINYLNPSLPLEPNIYSFKTEWAHTHEHFYLPTSPEMALKKQLAATKKNCFSLAHCFRDLEAEGPYHSKEFIMLEWYEVGKTYLDLIESTKKYISRFIDTKFSTLRLPSELPDNEPDFNQFFLNEIEPALPKNEAVFITGYPAYLSPLAAIGEVKEANGAQRSEVISRKESSTGNSFTSQIAQRFELYINGIEIANGCTENTDSNSIEKAFIIENNYRLVHHLPIHPYSCDFAEISGKLPPSAGIGLGIDRLRMLISVINGTITL